MGLIRRVVLVVLALCSVGAGRARAAQATLVADAHVSIAQPTVNAGSLSNLNIGNGYTTLLQFDLSLLPSGTTTAQVSRAVLRLYVNRLDTPGIVSLQAVSGSWLESSVTYATMPALGSVVQTLNVAQANAYIAFDVTALVQGWIANPSSNYGVALSAAAASLQLDSKENDLTAHPALLDISLVSQGPVGATGATGPAGSTGANGLNGANGATGPQGVAGANGATGATGVMGPTGPQGLAGALGATGATGSVGLTGPQGVTGPQGATGSQGATGPAGSGATGATGATGSQGATGPQGFPGLAYQGNYASTTNYALGDVVLWQGAAYASLHAGNQGNTPDQSPGDWGVLVQRGATGAVGSTGTQGPAGPQGLAGSAGPAGAQGPQGPQGIAGQAGAQGIAGATGAQGLQGPAGPQGSAGPVGLTWQGPYRAAANYASGDGVLYNGQAYVSLVASNHGNTPDQSSAAWSLFAASGANGAAGATGATGAQGSVGPQGAAGLPGPAGATGATGSQGAAGFNFMGTYASTVNYGLNDGVSFGGSTYISLTAGNHGNTPGLSPTYWAVLAAQGATGAAGPVGATGAAGATGAQGPQGAQGDAGPPVSFAGAWLTGVNYAVGAAVSYQGSSYIALVANVGREPDVSPAYWGLLAQAGAAGTTGAQGVQGFAGPQGVAGSTGPAGPAGPTGAGATIAIGTVTTGAPGSQASVTNTGSSTAAVLNFTLPQGTSGTNSSGSGAAQALSGIPFISTLHSVSFNTKFYALNGTGSALNEDQSVVTWVPGACTATRLTAYSQQANPIVITLRVGTSPTSLGDSALACTVSTGSSCTATSSISIAAGSFVDLSITGANGTVSPVWTALECD